MASPFLQYGKLTALAVQGGYSTNPRLSQDSAVFLLSACVYLREKWLWQNPINPIDNAEYNLILKLIEKAEYDLMTQYAIGTIIPSICIQNEDNMLELNGQAVQQSDYPLLTSCVPIAWLSGSDIVLPDMSDAGLFGTDSPLNTGLFVGSNDHVLTESEMPSHTHTQNPHSHSEIIPSVTPTGAGPVVAGASIVIPTPSVTGITTATNNNSGGDAPHNNVQRSLTVHYYIVSD